MGQSSFNNGFVQSADAADIGIIQSCYLLLHHGIASYSISKNYIIMIL